MLGDTQKIARLYKRVWLITLDVNEDIETREKAHLLVDICSRELIHRGLTLNPDTLEWV